MGGDEEQTQTQESSPWGPVGSRLTSDVFPRAEELFNQPGQFFQGQTYAGFDPNQMQGMQSQLDYAGGALPGQIQGFQDASQFALNAPDVANNPYVGGMADTITGRLNRNLDTTMGGIRDRMIESGQTGGSRHGVAQGIAVRGNQEALGDSLAQLYGNAYGQGLGAQTSAMGMAPQMTELGMLPGRVQQQVGGMMQGMDQQGINEAMQRHQFEQQEPHQRLGRYTDLLNASGSGYGSSTTTTQQETNPFGQILGLGMMAASPFMPGLAGPAMGMMGAGMGGGGNVWMSPNNIPYVQR